MDKFYILAKIKKIKFKNDIKREPNSIFSEGLEIAICTFYNIDNSIDLKSKKSRQSKERWKSSNYRYYKSSNSEEDGYIRMAYKNIINNWIKTKEKPKL